jgi:hypothetical protein
MQWLFPSTKYSTFLINGTECATYILPPKGVSTSIFSIRVQPKYSNVNDVKTKRNHALILALFYIESKPSLLILIL